MKKILFIVMSLALAAPAFATHDVEGEECMTAECIGDWAEPHAGMLKTQVEVVYAAPGFLVAGQPAKDVNEAKSVVVSKVNGMLPQDEMNYISNVLNKMTDSDGSTAQLTLYYNVHPDP